MRKHVIRLAKGKLGFFDPVNRINLFYPNRMYAEVPDGADLTYIMRALRSGLIEDVNGTLTGDTNKETSQKEEAKKAAQEKTPAEVDKKATQEKIVETIELEGGKITVTEEYDDVEEDKDKKKEEEARKKTAKKKKEK